MADVGERFRGSADDRDRGQLLLVAGLTIAVILVVLVLLLNTVIYTENVATRGLDTETDDALQYRATVVDSVEGIIAEENRRLYQNEGDLNTNVSNGTDLLNLSIEQRQKELGTLATFDLSSRNGIHIWQDTDSAFTDDNGTDSWLVVSGFTEMRLFEMNVSRSDLSNNSSDAFEVQYDGSNAIAIYQEGSNVTVDASGDTCSYATDDATLDFANHSFDGNYCTALNQSWSEIEFIRGNDVQGTYELTVADNDPLASDPPNHAYIIYDADVSAIYQTRDVNYRTTVHVEGAEPR